MFYMKLVFVVFILALGACQKKATLTEVVTELPLSAPSRIIGGVEVFNSDPLRKHLVILNTYTLNDINEKKPKEIGLCSGVIVSKNHILTAAHCVNKTGKYVIVEVYFTTSTQVSQAPMRYGIKKNFHPEYAQGNSSHFDLAVIKLNQEIPADYEPLSILPSAIEVQPGDEVQIVGYGLRWENPRMAASALNKISGIKVVDDLGTQLILDQTNGKGMCSGDSGGATLFNYEGRIYLLGINQGAKALKSSQIPNCSMHSVVLKAQVFRRWITSAMAKI